MMGFCCFLLSEKIYIAFLEMQENCSQVLEGRRGVRRVSVFPLQCGGHHSGDLSLRILIG